MQENKQAQFDAIFSGGGEMGERIRRMDWSTHPLGPIEGWSQSLKIIIRIMLTSRYAMWMGWGPELYFFYNDAYLPTLGLKESWALGTPARTIWAEIWPDIGPRAESVVQTGQSTWDEGLLLFLERSGYPEETYHTFSYSPVPDDSGSIGGMLCVVTEDTERVIGERRLAMLRELASDLASVNTEKELFDAVEHRFALYDKDLPFAMLYLFEEETKQARLATSHGVVPGTEIAPLTIDPDAPDQLWQVREMLDNAGSVTVQDITGRFKSLPTGAWDKPARQAVLIPIAQQGQETPAGFLTAAINPYRPFGVAYRGFLNLLAGQIAAGLSNVRAYEEERKRAERLAELDRAKTMFFSNVSHEFRTPLTLMLGPAEDALQDSEQPLPPNQHNRIQVLHRNGLRLLKLVNTLLDFSRIEAEREQANYEAVDLATYTAELAGVFRSAVEKAGMRLLVNCPPLHEPIYVDREMWEKIVLNLLSNAFKFTFEGEIEVTLQETAHAVELRVRDTGVGIPEADLPRIFERFHRSKGTQGRTHEGTGIGLALVQELAKFHGGKVEVESQYGKGSTFIVTVMKGTAHLPKERIAASSTLQSTAVGAMPFVEEALRWLPDEDGGQRSVIGSQLEEVKTAHQSPTTDHFPRILLADDNADMRDYIRRLLSEQYQVVAVANGLEALEAARQQPPDLILTDVMMTRLDGFGLLSELRRDAHTKTIPVIMLSARAGEESKVEGLEAGADDYLVKPFSARELLARVRANLEMSRIRCEVAEHELQLHAEADAARQQVEQVLSSMNDAFVALDREGRLIYLNDAAVTIFAGKSSKEEFLGKPFAEIFPEVVETPFDDAMRRVMSEKQPLQFECFYPFRNRWLETRIYPTTDGLSFFTTDITERKHAQEIFERYRLLSERARDVILFLRTDGQIIEANQAATETYGYDHQTFLQMQVAGLRASESLPHLAKQLREASSDGIQFETVHRRQDGTTFPVEVSARSAEIGDERFIVSIIRDITDRKRAESELAEAAQVHAALYQFADGLQHTGSLSDIYDLALDAILKALQCDRASILLFDESGVMRFVGWRGLSDSYRQFTEGHSPWTRDEKNPQPLPINDIRSANLETSLQTVIENEGIGALCFIPLVSQDKLIGKFMIYFNAPHNFRDEEMELGLTIARQLSFGIERKRAEEALRKSEERLRLATEAAHMFTWEVDLPSRATFVSDNFQEVFGASSEAFPMTVENVVKIFSHPEDVAPALEHLEDAINSDNTFQQEFRFRNPENSEMQWAEVRASVIRDDNNQPLRLLGITQNVTERKRAEQALRNSEAKLAIELADAKQLQHISSQLIQEDNINVLCEQILDAAIAVMRSDMGSMQILDPERNELRLLAWKGFDPQSAAYWEWVRVNSGSSCGVALNKGERMIVPDVETCEFMAGTEDFDFSCLSGIRAVQSTPLVSRNGNIVGMISTHWRNPHQPSERDLRLLDVLARQAADLIERKRVDEALRESEERLRAMFTQAGVGVVLQEVDCTMRQVNPKFCEITGYDESELLGGSCLAMTHPDDKAENIRLIEQLMASKDETASFDKRYIRKDGSLVWVRLTIAKILNASGDVSQLVAIVEDITERKQVESERQQLIALAEGSTDFICMCDLEGMPFYANKAGLEMVGLDSLEQLLHTPVREFFFPEDQAMILNEFFPSVLEKGNDEVEIRFRHFKTGAVLWMLYRVFALNDAKGQRAVLATVSRDITGRKQAEEASAHLAAIVASSSDAIVSKTLDGIITSWNASAERMFGYTAQEIIGQPVLRLIPPDRYDEETQILANLRAGGHINHFETVRVTKEGRHLEVSLTVSPIKDSTGKIIGASKIARDITERKQIEAERERLLYSEQAARQQAEEANRLKDEFLATVSHELRTPLNAILGWAALARNSNFNAESIEKALTIIERNARNQNQIIADVLDVSRIITGKFNLDVRSVELLSILESAIDTMRPAIDARRIWLRRDFDAEGAVVMGDASRLQQVFWNLLSNAVKFTPEGGIIDVSLKRLDHHMIVTVRDNGEGITPEFLPFVFDRFRQADGGINRKHGGLGLGLAIVRHIIELHGGTAMVTSEGLNQGATFTIKLPLALSASTNNGQPLTSPQPVGKPNNELMNDKLAGMRILVVDDEMDTCLLLKHFLTRSGAEVVMAESVDEALKRLAAASFDLLISDIGMPGKDGFDLIQQVRNLTAGSHIPAIAVTAYARSEDRRRVLAAGYEFHLPKPIDPEDLIQRAAQIGRKQVARL